MRRSFQVRLIAWAAALLLTAVAAAEWCWIAGWNPARALPQAQESLPERLHRAARENDPVTVLAVLESGVSPDLQDGYGQTALRIAAASGAVETVQLLLDYGADCNLADDRGVAPLTAAVAADAGRIAELLLNSGAAVNPLPPLVPPLETARKSGNASMAALLTACGAVERR